MKVEPVYNDLNGTPMKFHKFLCVVIWIGVVLLSITFIGSLFSIDVFSIVSIITFALVVCAWGCALAAASGLKHMQWSGVKAYYYFSILNIATYIITPFLYSYMGLDTQKVMIEAIVGPIIYGVQLALIYIYYGKRRNLFNPSEIFANKISKVIDYRKEYGARAKKDISEYIGWDNANIIVDAAFDNVIKTILETSKFPAEDELKEENQKFSAKYREEEPEKWADILRNFRRAAEGSEVQIENVIVGKGSSDNPISRILAVAGTYSILMSKENSSDTQLKDVGDDKFVDMWDDIIQTFHNKVVSIIEGDDYDNEATSIENNTITQYKVVDVPDHLESSSLEEKDNSSIGSFMESVSDMEEKEDTNAISNIYDERVIDTKEKSEIETFEEPAQNTPEFDGIRFCFRCGHEIGPDAVFCEKCGNRVR